MRNDLERLVWVPGHHKMAALVPEDPDEIAILAQIIHDAEHEPYDDEDEPIEDEEWLDELNADYSNSRGV